MFINLNNTMGDELTPGARGFAAFLEENGVSVAKAADELGVVRTVLHYWKHGTQRPRPELREKIERWTGGVVKADSWFTKKERAAFEKIEPFQPAPEEG